MSKTQEEERECTTSTITIEYENYLKLLANSLVLNAINKATETKKNEDKEKIKKYLNLERWYCISRPQYKYSCGISSLVSCWNYLFSQLGHGQLPVLTQERAIEILGFSEPFDEIRFGPFTGNATLMKWFQQLNEHFGVSGSSSFFYKPKGKSRTIGVSDTDAKTRLKEGLQSTDKAFIYHCFNHYCTPIGFEEEPKVHSQIYTSDADIDCIDWLLVADTSRKYQSIHCFKWEDVSRDLNMQNPDYINIRELDKGVLKYESKRMNEHGGGGNLHCIILFQRD